MDDDTVVRLQIWDTAGQERFRSMAPMYYRSANCGIICYDITSRDSFNAMHSWLVELKENPLVDEDLTIYIVGTKLDLVDENPSLRQVSFEDCVAYAANYLDNQKKRDSLSPPFRSHNQSNRYPEPNANPDKTRLSYSPPSQLNPSIKSKLLTTRRRRRRRHTFNDQTIPSCTNPTNPASQNIAPADKNHESITVTPSVSTPRRHRPSGGQTTSESTLDLETPEFFTEYSKSKKMHKSKTSNDIFSYLNKSSGSNHIQSSINDIFNDRNESVYSNEPNNKRIEKNTSDQSYSQSKYTDSTDIHTNNIRNLSKSDLEYFSSFCFEISAKNNRGISQLFETINRRLVEQHYNKQYQEMCKNEKGYYQERLYNTRDLQGKTVSLDRDSETQDYQSFGSRCC